MDIRGKVHCFFEQSGTFKNEFIKMGIPAEDYDIQDNFGQTDHVIDLFHEISEGYMGGQSVFESITSDDLVMSFFPCIYFCENNQLYFTGKHHNQKMMTAMERNAAIIDRARLRESFYETCLKMFTVCERKGIRMIMENPFATAHYLIGNFPYQPSLIDPDRTRRGDFFKKPTAYWFIRCEPTRLFSEQVSMMKKRVASERSGKMAGICSEDRSMISPDYARNFICDNILGRPQPEICPTLFD